MKKKWNNYIICLGILYINSLFIGLILPMLNVNIELLSLSPYVLYAITIFLSSNINSTTQLEPKIKKTMIINNIVAIFIILNGWYMTTLRVKEVKFVACAIGYVLLSILSLRSTLKIKSRINESNNKNKIAFKDEIEIYKSELNTEKRDLIISESIIIFEYILIIICYAIIPEIIKRVDNRAISIFVSFIFLLVLVIVNMYKNFLFFKRNVVDTVLIVISAIIIYYIQGVIYYKTGIINFAVYFIVLIFLYKVFRTNKQIHNKCNEIKNKRQG